MPSTETVRVTIFNQTYSLRSISGAEHVKGIARLVDDRMKQIASHLTTHDISKIAILVALNIADEMQSLKAQYESERSLKPESTDKVAEDGSASSLESKRGSWFDEIFDADMVPKDRTERLSTQISAKLHANRKPESPETIPGGNKE